jgi:predicted SAM-dependent methyltransferase
MGRRSMTAEDTLGQIVWRAKALPVRAGSLAAPTLMVRRARGATRVHLGCGRHLLDGWANLDMDGPRGVVRFNLTRPLPFPSGSVDLVFTEHFVEHIRLDQALALVRECARILRPGGVIRISTPDLRRLVDEYLSGNTDEWSDMGWSPATPCDLVNEGMRLWGHVYLWDQERLAKALIDSGFRDVARLSPHQSDHVALRGLESRPDHGDLILEATR